MTIVDLIRLMLMSSGVKTPREYEALILYDMQAMRMAANVPQRSTNRQALTEFASRLDAGICGEAANQLAEILLRAKVGEALKNASTEVHDGRREEWGNGHIGDHHACWGRGMDRLKEAMASFFGFGDAVFMINLGPSHRFLAIKQGTSVEVLQVWYDPSAHVGYGLTDWLAGNNTQRIRHTVDEFVTALGKALTGSVGDARELFQPLQGPTLPASHFEMSGTKVSFAAVGVNAKTIASNFLKYHVDRVSQLN